MELLNDKEIRSSFVIPTIAFFTFTCRYLPHHQRIVAMSISVKSMGCKLIYVYVLHDAQGKLV